MTFLPFIIQRARRHWHMLSMLSLGVVLATALLASGPLLIDTVIELSLRRTLQSASAEEGHVRLTTHIPAEAAAYQALDEQLQALIQKHFGAYLGQVLQSRASTWMFPWRRDQLLADQRVNLRTYTGVERHVKFVAGSWPASPSGASNVIPVAIPDEMAQLYALRVGDRLPLSLQRTGVEPQLWLEVTGIVRARNLEDPYWFGSASPLASQSTDRWQSQYSALIPEDVLLPALASLGSQADMEVGWHVLLDHEAMSGADIFSLQSDLDAFARDLGALDTRVVLQTGLDGILQRFENQSETVRAPLYVLIAEIVLLALYYVTMVAALSMGSAEREFAVLRSRGASGFQISRIQLTEAGLIVGVALLSGPLLGSLLVRGLSWAGPLADVGTSALGLSLTQSAWLAASAGTIACLAGLLLPLGPALRRSIVTHQQHITRAARPPWWQRIYLDVFLLAGGLILLWRLHLYGELVIGGASGPRVDWLLLLSPLALLLGTAAILLRVFPLVLRGLATLAARARGLSGALALWQAARNPTHVARLVLLLTLAIALGILSTGLNATLDRSESERANYIAGNDIRLASDHAIPLPAIQATPSVEQLAGAWRGEGSIQLQSARSYPRFEALAIQPYAFAEVTQYRDDFSSQNMGQLLGYLVAERNEMPPTLPLPGLPSRLGLWLRTRVSDEQYGAMRQYFSGESDLDRLGLSAKLQTAQGELFTVELGPSQAYQPPEPSIDQFVLRGTLGDQEWALRFDIQPVDDGWRYFDAPIPTLPASSYPLRLYALWFHNQARASGRAAENIQMQLSLDDLSVLDGEAGELLPVETFDDPLRIWSLNSLMSGARFTKQAPHTGSAGMDLDLRFSSQEKLVSLQLTKGLPKDTLPALVSPAFLETTELQVGDLVRSWVESIEVKFKLVGVVQYFPTLYEEQEAGFLITSLDRLLPLLNGTSPRSVNINQVFLETDGSVSIDQLAESVPQISQSWQAEAVRKTFKANPLGLGLRSVTFFGYTLTTLLSLVGFATHFYMSARQRETFYGVMRAMGLSPRQLYGSMILEQAVLILTGLALGTVLGVVLNQITLPRLPIALGGGPPVPPFRPQADWLAVGRIYIALAVAFLLALGVATGLLWRARIHRALRIGQE